MSLVRSNIKFLSAGVYLPILPASHAGATDELESIRDTHYEFDDIGSE